MKAVLKNGSEIDRERWEEFILNSPQGNVYALPGYMDIIAPDWSGIELEDEGKLIAVMPIMMKKKGLWKYALQPFFSQHWGIFLSNEKWKSAYKEFSDKRKIVSAIIEMIPDDIAWIAYGFSYLFDYPIPLHWKGYTLKTRYTYHLSLRESVDVLLENMGKDTRYLIRKTQEWEARIFEGKSAESMIDLLRINSDAGKAIPPGVDPEILKRLADFLLKNKRGFLLEAKTEDGKVIASALFGQCCKTTVYLMSAVHPDYRSEGVVTQLLWQGILHAKKESEIFDFEGSMIEGIESFFRGFSARPVSYLFAEKNNLPLVVRWIKS